MSFTWDWLLLKMIDTGILDYYQVNVCADTSDIVLYKLGRCRGVLLRECHIVKRTSASCYRMTSFNEDMASYSSFKNVTQLCNYLIEHYIPDYRVPLTPHEKMAKLREKRASDKAAGLIPPEPPRDDFNGYVTPAEEYYYTQGMGFGRRK